MDYQSNMKDARNLQANPSAIVKTITLIVPNPSKMEITGKRSFTEAMVVEEEDS